MVLRVVEMSNLLSAGLTFLAVSFFSSLNNMEVAIAVPRTNKLLGYVIGPF